MPDLTRQQQLDELLKQIADLDAPFEQQRQAYAHQRANLETMVGFLRDLIANAAVPSR